MDQVVNISIRRDRKKDNDIPDAKDFAKKYNIEFEEDDDDDDAGDILTKDNEVQEAKAEKDVIRDIAQGQEVNKRVESLMLKLDEKSREIERLCILLEAVEPVDGLDPEKFLTMMDGNTEDNSTDYRDAKIVQLAKKCRNLTVALNKERGSGHSRKQEIEELSRRCEQLQQELDLVSSPAARAAAARDNRETSNNKESDPKDIRRELIQANKQTDEWRKKFQAAQEEMKKLQRVLTKELGDGVTVDQAVDDGWRGRAQQIVMLKNKIKRLETGVTAGSTMSSSSTVASSRSRAKNGPGGSSSDVDSKAMEDLADMSSDRQQAIEALTEDHGRLREEYQQLKQKSDGQKARIKILENDVGKQKAQLKVLLEKTSSDDELIEALREEVSKVKAQAQQADKEQRAVVESSVPRVVKLGGGGGGTSSSSSGQIVRTAASSKDRDRDRDRDDCTQHAVEISRLSRLCTQQAQQLETQDTVIQQLRAAVTQTHRK